ncbi:unnamed protein product [Acanthoscelides obtectus]|uniref:Uncharacterized protein n=1 Tax=Acanthoscelides obtectus TaxID=200917 RepID=A0A9P0L4N1_ACAOB|nr:unnamed protein product [Acanthoscelides obtectus]CAK1651662.1 hypothetical protein AOBTE_LOCUS17380 [Acanthoscelides obtectus]
MIRTHGCRLLNVFFIFRKTSSTSYNSFVFIEPGVEIVHHFQSIIKNATTNGRSEFDDNVPDPNIITDSIMGAIFRTTSIRDVRANTLEMSRNERSNEQNVQLRIVTISD